MYPDVQLLIDGVWCDAASGKTLPVVNPATGDPIGTVSMEEGVRTLRVVDACLRSAASGGEVRL